MLPVRSLKHRRLALAFLVAQFGINIAGNAVAGGIDLASLFPKYINIRRGAYIVSADQCKGEVRG